MSSVVLKFLYRYPDQVSVDGSIQTLLLFAVPVMTAVGAAIMTAIIMQAHAECLVARERARAAELRTALQARDQVEAARIRGIEEAARRRALDEILSDIRVEERQFRRGHGVLLQERVFFRTVPLTGWIEHELPPGPEPRAPLRTIEAARQLTCP